MAKEEQSIDELINKVNYKRHASEIGHTIIDDDNNETVIFGDDALNVMGFHEDRKLLEEKLNSY